MKDESGAGLDLFTYRCLLAGNLFMNWVLSDASMGSLIERLEGLATEGLLPMTELLLEGTWVILFEQIVIFLHVHAHDMFKMLFSSEDGLGLLLLLLSAAALLLSNDSLRFFPAETREAVIVVRHVEAAITSTLHGTKDTVTSGRSNETDIEVCLERTPLVFIIVNVVVLAVGGLLALKLGVDRFALEKASGEEKSSCVGCSIVGQTAFDAVVFKLARLSS